MNFGEILVNSRNEIGVDVSIIARELRIREEYLKAFEEENLADFPEEPFGIGFFRKYVDYLEIYDIAVFEAYKNKLEAFNIERAESSGNKINHRNESGVKIQQFQMDTFWQNRMKTVKKHHKNISLFSVIVFVIFIIFCLLLVRMTNKSYALSEIHLAEFSQLQEYCLEVKTLKPVWLSILRDGKVYVSKIVRKGVFFRIFADNDFKIVIGDIDRIQALINGKAINIRKGAKGSINTLTINKETLYELTDKD
ncbi:MAG: DUF4115 domain-containing protein [bacterium]|nr:DUF4115 domain-containing protein [bacterium]